MSTNGDRPTTPAPGDRLERALELFLSGTADDPATAAELLATHADLRDLLEPMLEGSRGDHDADQDDDVLGDFRLLEELGRGGMGVVYAAWQRSLDRKVAVKVLAPALVASPSAVARFRREAAAAGRLRHRNIVEVHGFGSSGDRHFFAMQLVDGVPLHSCRERFRAAPDAIAIAIQLADALQHAHEQGLVHRDVKPANVLVQADGTALLTDFGVASDASLPTLTVEGGFLGTLDYAAPEQLRGEPVDARADVWGLGLVLHELVAGQHPFQAATQEATMQRVLTHEPSLRGRPGVSRDLCAVVGRALEKDPRRRYATAAAMAQDLRAIQQGAPVSARLPRLTERAVRWARREPWRALATASLVVGLPTLAAALGYLQANAPRIEAARAAERAQQREEALAHGWLLYHEGDPAAGAAALAQAVFYADPEFAVSRALMLHRQGDAEGALAAMEGLSGEAARIVRAEVDATGGPEPTADASLDDFVVFVRASLLATRATARGAHNAPMLREAAGLAELAVALAEHPRLPYLVTLAGIGQEHDDRRLAIEAERALARHFPQSHIARRMRARILARTAPAEALTLLEDRPGERSLAGAWLMRGVALETLGRLDEALQADRNATAEEPGNARAWTNLGTVLRKQKHLAESEQALRRATEADPTDVFAWNGLGLTLRAAGRRDEAVQAFRRAMDLRPDYAAPAYNLGNLHNAAGDAEAAIAAFERAVTADPDDVRAVANLGDALQRAGRPQEALPLFVRATQLAPRDLIPNHNLARTALELGLPGTALPAARRAHELDRKSHHGAWVLADALLAQPAIDAPAALDAARAAAERARGNVLGVRLTLARAMAASGDRAAAEATLEDAIAEPRFAADDDLPKARAMLQELRR